MRAVLRACFRLFVFLARLTHLFRVECAAEDLAALKALRGMGLETVVNGGGGGMDANNWNAAGIATVGVATGYSSNHCVSEQIYLDDLLRAGELAENIVMTWAEMGLPE